MNVRIYEVYVYIYIHTTVRVLLEELLEAL